MVLNVQIIMTNVLGWSCLIHVHDSQYILKKGCTTIRRKPFRQYNHWSHTTFGRCDISPSMTFGRKK